MDHKRVLSALVMLFWLLVPAGGETAAAVRVRFTGEELVFSIGYGLLEAGQATLRTSDTVWNETDSCYRIAALTTSNQMVSFFYPVRDTICSYMDHQELCSRKIYKVLNEGRYHDFRTTVFDQVKHTARVKEKTFSVPPRVQDILSAFYFFRTLDLDVGSQVDIETFDNSKGYPIRVNVIGRNKIEVPAGTFQCVEVVPILRTTGIVKAKGKMHIWLTDDKYRMPVMVKVEIPIGKITGKLIAYKRLL
jgi:hypothetical protein